MGAYSGGDVAAYDDDVAKGGGGPRGGGGRGGGAIGRKVGPAPAPEPAPPAPPLRPSDIPGWYGAQRPPGENRSVSSLSSSSMPPARGRCVAFKNCLGVVQRQQWARLPRQSC